MPGASRRASLTGLAVLLTATTMVFAAFTSAFWVRRGLSNDWTPTPLPRVLWVNTAVLLASSGVLEAARRALKAGQRSAHGLARFQGADGKGLVALQYFSHGLIPS